MVTLSCSHEQFAKLHEAVDSARRNSSTVKIDKSAPAAMLRDHAALIRLHRHEIGGVL